MDKYKGKRFTFTFGERSPKEVELDGLAEEGQKGQVLATVIEELELENCYFNVQMENGEIIFALSSYHMKFDNSEEE